MHAALPAVEAAQEVDLACHRVRLHPRHSSVHHRRVRLQCNSCNSLLEPGSHVAAAPARCYTCMTDALNEMIAAPDACMRAPGRIRGRFEVDTVPDGDGAMPGGARTWKSLRAMSSSLLEVQKPPPAVSAPCSRYPVTAGRGETRMLGTAGAGARSTAGRSGSGEKAKVGTRAASMKALTALISSQPPSSSAESPAAVSQRWWPPKTAKERVASRDGIATAAARNTALGIGAFSTCGHAAVRVHMLADGP